MLLIEEIKEDLLLQEDQCLLLHQFLGNNLHKPKDQVFHHLNSNQQLLQWAVLDQDQWQQIFLHLLKVHQWAVQEEAKLILDHQSMPKLLLEVMDLFYLSTNHLSRIRNRELTLHPSVT